MANIETYDNKSAILAYNAIQNPTEENINKSVLASLEAAKELTKYIMELNNAQKE
jgi:hypothetical protein